MRWATDKGSRRVLRVVCARSALTVLLELRSGSQAPRTEVLHISNGSQKHSTVSSPDITKKQSPAALRSLRSTCCWSDQAEDVRRDFRKMSIRARVPTTYNPLLLYNSYVLFARSPVISAGLRASPGTSLPTVCCSSSLEADVRCCKIRTRADLKNPSTTPDAQ